MLWRLTLVKFDAGDGINEIYQIPKIGFYYIEITV